MKSGGKYVPRADNKTPQHSSPFLVRASRRERCLGVGISRLEAVQLPEEVILRSFVQAKIRDDGDGQVDQGHDIRFAVEIVHAPESKKKNVRRGYERGVGTIRKDKKKR